MPVDQVETDAKSWPSESSQNEYGLKPKPLIAYWLTVRDWPLALIRVHGTNGGFAGKQCQLVLWSGEESVPALLFLRPTGDAHIKALPVTFFCPFPRGFQLAMPCLSEKCSSTGALR
jgi:hypothetical protein